MNMFWLIVAVAVAMISVVGILSLISYVCFA